jgi:hypothetical protein
MMTDYFPEHMVQFVEQRDWKLKGLYGPIILSGNEVRTRQRRNSEGEAEYTRQCAQARRRQSQEMGAERERQLQLQGGLLYPTHAGPSGLWATEEDPAAQDTLNPRANPARTASAAPPTPAPTAPTASAARPPKVDKNDHFPTMLAMVLYLTPDSIPNSLAERPMRIWNRYQWQNATKSMKSHFHRALKRMAAQLRDYHRDEKLPNLPAKLVTSLEEAKEEVKARAAAAIQANVANGYLALRAPQEEERMDVDMSHPPPAAAAPAARAAAAPGASDAAAATAKAATTAATATPTQPREEPSQMTSVQEQELMEYEEEDTL